MRHSVGDFIYSIRREKGWTLREAAKRIGIAHSRLDEYEKGFDNHSGKMVVPSYLNVVRISLAYGIPPNESLRLAGYKPGSELKPDEISLLKVYRSLSEPQRRRVWEFIETLGSPTQETPLH